MANENDAAAAVKAANRKLYDAVAGSYESIDGRRSRELERWLRRTLSTLRSSVGAGRLLDIGSGSGLVTRCAQGIFSERVSLDLSAKILAAHREHHDLAVCADVDELPFPDRTFDVVVSFAVLHHLYRFDGLVAEVKRVLKPGGVYYADHDMDAAFGRRYRLPLALYRRVSRAVGKYVDASREIDENLYHLAEWQGQGVDSGSLAALLESRGFRVSASYHWFGLSALTNKLFKERTFARGSAPLLRIIAGSGSLSP